MMKITAGLGHVDDYPAYIHAGADEVFCGYVPDRWYEKYGMDSPLNRREVRYAHAQIGGRNELLVLRSMIDDLGAPAILTLNALSYLPEQYPIVTDIVGQCFSDGFSEFIVADPALLYYLNSQIPDIRVHLSGESFTMNPEALSLFDFPTVKRIIFHRHLSVSEIRKCILSAKHCSEFEAFVLNERCHFHGALCASVHCDELSPICRLPYLLGSLSSDASWSTRKMDQDPEVFSSTGCGLCALYDLDHSGITHLKIVGRGNSPENMIRDIQMVKKATTCCEYAPSREDFLKTVKSILQYPCSNNCYYSQDKKRHD